MKISKMASRIQPSLTRMLYDKAKQYDNVIDFTLGDPDFITPLHIREAGCKAIMEGRTKYSANAGLLELRQVISDSIVREHGVCYAADREIMVTAGAMEALYLAMCCLIDEGDEVIIPAPYWINYQHMTQLCNGVPVIVNAKEENDFVARMEDIASAITSRTRAIILNSPNNPTGTIYDRETLSEICKLAKENDFVVIWDECYRSITYDGEHCPSILEFEGIKDYAVVVNSCSKKFSMTGWRLGYAAAPAELVTNMAKLQENVAACAPLPSQYAAIAAFKEPCEETEDMCRKFENRRNLLVNGINQIEGLSCKLPKGAFYAFGNIKNTGLGSVDFAFKLLESQQVAVVPGVTYGECCEGYVRIAYTVSEEKIREGLKRLHIFMQGL